MGTHISYENAKNQRCDVLLRSESSLRRMYVLEMYNTDGNLTHTNERVMNYT